MNVLAVGLQKFADGFGQGFVDARTGVFKRGERFADDGHFLALQSVPFGWHVIALVEQRQALQGGLATAGCQEQCHPADDHRPAKRRERRFIVIPLIKTSIIAKSIARRSPGRRSRRCRPWSIRWAWRTIVREAAESKSHEAPTTLKPARSVPPALAARARPTSPRSSQAHDVVMPQAGQGR